MMNMLLYIGIYGVHSMELIYNIMKLEFVAMPDSELGVSCWAGEQTLIVGRVGTCTATVYIATNYSRYSMWGDHAVMVATYD